MIRRIDDIPFTAYIGIDWADTKHDACLLAAGSEQREFMRFSHQVDSIEAWAHSMHQRFGGPIAVVLELSKGPIVYALQKHEFFVLFPVNTSTLAKYREALTPSRAKDDSTDAKLALDLLIRQPERFKALRPQSIEMRTLMSLVEQRSRLVADKNRFTNRLRDASKQYYPQTLEWFDHIDTPVFCDFISRGLTLLQVKRARRCTLEGFFHAHNMRFAHVLEARLKSIKAATAFTLDQAVATPHRLQALVLVDQLRITVQAIQHFYEEIAVLASKHADYPLFSALPGAGPQLAPRLLAALVSSASVSKTPLNCSGMPASRRSRCAAARNIGCTGAGNARPSIARRSLSGLPKPSTSRSGPVPSTASSAQRAAPARPLYAPLHSNESAYSTVAGLHARRTMRPSTSGPCNAMAQRYHSSWPPQNNLTKELRA
jgi:hypothetical protein